MTPAPASKANPTAFVFSEKKMWKEEIPKKLILHSGLALDVLLIFSLFLFPSRCVCVCARVQCSTASYLPNVWMQFSEMHTPEQPAHERRHDDEHVLINTLTWVYVRSDCLRFRVRRQCLTMWSRRRLPGNDNAQASIYKFMIRFFASQPVLSHFCILGRGAFGQTCTAWHYIRAL